MCVWLFKKGSGGGWERDVSHTLQYRGGRTVGVWQNLFCVSVVGRTRALLPNGPTAGPALLLRGLATGFRTAEETGHPLSRRASPDRRLGHLVPARGWAVDLGRFDGGRGQRQTGVGSVYQTLASSSHHRLVPVSRSVSPRQVCQNHSRNAHYVVAFKNPRDQLGIRNLLMQEFPTYWRDALRVYEEVTQPSYAYLMLDLHPASDDRYRLFVDLLKGQGWTRTFTRRPQDGHARTSVGWWTHRAMAVGRLPVHRAGVATRQFAPLVASLRGGAAFPSTAALTSVAAFARTADPRVATVAPQLGWDSGAPTHTFPSVFAHPFSPTLESRWVTTSDRVVDARSTTTVSKPVHPSGDPYQYHHYRQ